jgi:thioredoxin-related protein
MLIEICDIINIFIPDFRAFIREKYNSINILENKRPASLMRFPDNIRRIINEYLDLELSFLPNFLDQTILINDRPSIITNLDIVNAHKIIKNNDREYYLNFVRQNASDVLESASEELKNDKEFILVVVTQDGTALKYASDTLQNDRDVILAAITQNGRAFKYASDELKSDEEVAIKALINSHTDIFMLNAICNIINIFIPDFRAFIREKYNSINILENKRPASWIRYSNDIRRIINEYLYPELSFSPNFLDQTILINDIPIITNLDIVKAHKIIKNNDREYYLNFVRQNCNYALKFASDELKNNKEFFLVVVTQDGIALKYASDTLKNDRDVVFAAITQNYQALCFVSDELLNDIEVFLTAVTQNGYALFYASNDFKANKTVVLAAVTQNGYAFINASNELKSDKEVAIKALININIIEQYIYISSLIDTYIPDFGAFIREKYNSIINEYFGPELSFSPKFLDQTILINGIPSIITYCELIKTHKIINI